MRGGRKRRSRGGPRRIRRSRKKKMRRKRKTRMHTRTSRGRMRRRTKKSSRRKDRRMQSTVKLAVNIAALHSGRRRRTFTSCCSFVFFCIKKKLIGRKTKRELGENKLGIVSHAERNELGLAAFRSPRDELGIVSLFARIASQTRCRFAWVVGDELGLVSPRRTWPRFASVPEQELGLLSLLASRLGLVSLGSSRTWSRISCTALRTWSRFAAEACLPKTPRVYGSYWRFWGMGAVSGLLLYVTLHCFPPPSLVSQSCLLRLHWCVSSCVQGTALTRGHSLWNGYDEMTLQTNKQTSKQ